MLSHIGGLLSGAAISSVFVLNMNDVIYEEMRRNLVLPI
jgi:hypothetical protein